MPEIDTSPDNGRGGWVPYLYYPSVPAAGIFVALFTICAAVHIFRLFKYKGWYFIPFIIGIIFEAIGYVGRIGSHYNFNSLGFFIMQSLLILLAPALFAASIYMTLSRIAIALHAEQFLVIRARWLTTFFVTGDVLSFLAQSSGGGLMAGGKPDSAKLGQKVITGGLFIQIFFFCGFIIIATIFHRRLSTSPSHAIEKVKGRKYIWTMYAANGLILIRSMFRVIEYIMPHDGPLLANEAYLYVFDATLMFIVVALYIVVKPYGDLFDEWKRRKDAGGLELTRR
ncbi:hypothetical protein H072_11105 [Dactylellina haptotyla CBS 200.50]|uniref:RTA1 like protein n=1 Tax=Dactylellina haptotyla (strain CBS 200.50) TaxID=1284197 RepID=S8B926_DACHA|nr:hypothetical protein H072_11105 [Dactylellina haptotyla CBS 200.50]